MPQKNHSVAAPGAETGAGHLQKVSANQCPTAGPGELSRERAPWPDRWTREYRGGATRVSKPPGTGQARRLTFMVGDKETVDSGLLVVCSRKAAVHAVVIGFL